MYWLGGNNPVKVKNTSLIPGSKGQCQGLNCQEKSEPNSQKILLQDNYRFRSLKSIEVVNKYGEGIRLPLTLKGDDNFLTTVGFGTPKIDFTLIFDTGSDKTWINCNNNQVPFFDPSSSSTSSNVSCNPCNYRADYADGTYSTGYYANDTLTITSNPYPNFVFGCAQEIKGNFGGANGLLGVGPGQFSLMAQTDTSYFSLFCYCLPATESSTGYIVFGVQAYETCQPDENKMIPIGPAPTDKSTLTSYSVKLTAITIGQQRLPMSSSLNAVIDSGTVITRLPPSLYSSLSSAFQGLMSQYPRAPRSPPLLDICYNLVGHTNWTPPNMVLQFEGLNVPLEPSAVTFRDKNDSQVCLAFARNVKEDDLIIIGNKQHRALNIFFDISNKNMAFGRGCSNI
ncbi:hypothetical protein JCGZ_07052 [Jatropha curcas]|uniref:Peptidase A1 domain-containing protein n=1 Tax=Jatropha curcas TaxID=180498 RepID=A0A067KB76_JATCU|nr:hypothetical protein JCGZ_07052 [Jatropha curcas]